MADLVKKAWDLVNGVETRQDVIKAEAFIRENVKNNDDFDDLMMALTFQSRELYHAERR
jgi:hypothetical protein